MKESKKMMTLKVFLSKGDKIYDFLLLLGASGAAWTV